MLLLETTPASTSAKKATDDGDAGMSNVELREEGR
jgi:hypothetical protein